MRKGKRGLTRHANNKHPSTANKPPSTNDVYSPVNVTDKELDVDIFSKLFEKGLKKMANDKCLPENVTNELKLYAPSMQDITHSYLILQAVTVNFVSKIFLPHFTTLCRKLIIYFLICREMHRYFFGFDLANHIVAYVCHGYFHDENSGFETAFPATADLTEKEKDIIGYLSGYVFGTFSRRIRNSEKWNSPVNQQHLKILLNGKTDNVHCDMTLVTVKDRGGLWKVTPEVCKVFSAAELLSISQSQGNVHKINTAEMVSKLLVNTEILSNYSLIYREPIGSFVSVRFPMQKTRFKHIKLKNNDKDLVHYELK